MDEDVFSSFSFHAATFSSPSVDADGRGCQAAPGLEEHDITNASQ
jgi:hypothetical protein